MPLALAADYVVAREDIVLNPYYQHMGGLYGSEYWTYLLPRRVGPATTARLTERAVPPRRDSRGGQDRACSTPPSARTWTSFEHAPLGSPNGIAHDGLHQARLQDKRRRRALDERVKPLQAYRDEELARCHECFFGPDTATTRRGGGSSTSSTTPARAFRDSTLPRAFPTTLREGRVSTPASSASESKTDPSLAPMSGGCREGRRLGATDRALLFHA